MDKKEDGKMKLKSTYLVELVVIQEVDKSKEKDAINLFSGKGGYVFEELKYFVEKTLLEIDCDKVTVKKITIESDSGKVEWNE